MGFHGKLVQLFVLIFVGGVFSLVWCSVLDTFIRGEFDSGWFRGDANGQFAFWFKVWGCILSL